MTTRSLHRGTINEEQLGQYLMSTYVSITLTMTTTCAFSYHPIIYTAVLCMQRWRLGTEDEKRMYDFFFSKALAIGRKGVRSDIDLIPLDMVC